MLNGFGLITRDLEARGYAPFLLVKEDILIGCHSS